ncbi:hypothetical protein BST81_21745 [Leptolyngbya sp. 'hensonii']|uniref:DUF3370 domain-containing protein n=1 Tax=Leptolyngbya sp. 'hensonii' TaxID=1922337 RepID=UPI0009501E9B|nr:DUF3370 domain-containing protein [Leptolyngbya sp. 'hensonii']OLP16230.1 hypothetical protein BST81_21745 [Leptolyngbya sp. 'hensonii']
MLLFLSSLSLAQATPAIKPQEVLQIQEVRALSGQLDAVPTFNSNSPELVLTEGILLSTFPPQGKRVPAAHLNFRFRGRFDVFAHHIAKAIPPTDLRTLYLGIILHNPGKQAVTVDVLQAASYLSQPDAPFIDLPSQVKNPLGEVYSGPGSRAMDEILRGKRQADFPAQIVILPGESRMLLNLPIPVRELTPPINGRSTLMRLRSTGDLYAASLALFARQNADGSERPPTVEEWETLVQIGDLATPRDRTPTPPNQQQGQIIYGRVAGVAQGSQWRTRLTDQPDGIYLTIPQPGQTFSYGLSTLKGGTLGTGQIQAAPMLARYPDTAYLAQGNYAIQYSLTLALVNPTADLQTVTLSLQTPIKQEQIKDGLRFLEPPPKAISFRGTVRVRYTDDRNLPQTLYMHLVQRRGQQGDSLVTLNMPAGDRRFVQVDLLYPPDSTPPQVLTLKTLDSKAPAQSKLSLE